MGLLVIGPVPLFLKAAYHMHHTIYLLLRDLYPDCDYLQI